MHLDTVGNDVLRIQVDADRGALFFQQHLVPYRRQRLGVGASLTFDVDAAVTTAREKQERVRLAVEPVMVVNSDRPATRANVSDYVSLPVRAPAYETQRRVRHCRSAAVARRPGP